LSGFVIYTKNYPLLDSPPSKEPKVGEANGQPPQSPKGGLFLLPFGVGGWAFLYKTALFWVTTKILTLP